MPHSGDWNEWSRHVLKELERLNDCYENIQEKIRCDVHHQRIKGLEARFNQLIFAFIIIVISGIVLGVWVKAVAG